MPDRTIPYYNLILRCDAYAPQKIALPEGFSLRRYRPGDETAWAALECEIGDFDTPAEAERYFRETYLPHPEELARRGLFLEGPEGEVVGSCIAWKDPRGAETVGSLHWLVVSPRYQGQGLGKALCRKTLELFGELGEFPVYLHTQPWSWKALLLYVRLGFSLLREDSFKDYENQYEAGMAALKNVVSPEQYEELLQAGR